MDNETWLNARQAKEEGFIDEIIENKNNMSLINGIEPMLSEETIEKIRSQIKLTAIPTEDKEAFLNAKKQPLRKHEDVCVFYKKQPTYNPQMTEGEPYNKGVRKNQLSGSYGDFQPVHVQSDGERYPVDIVYVKTAESEGEVVHPTQKPIELGRYFVRTYTKPGDIILDNT